MQFIFYTWAVLLANVEPIPASWIDKDTPHEHHHLKSLVDKSELVLVFSDEFEAEGRSFADGHDPKWTSINKDDYTNDALQYYKNELVSTSNGKLNITTVNQDIHFMAYDKDPSKKAKKITKHYQSGMLQGWNKFCFTGGVVEVSAKLPGDSDIGGLWPAMWLLGNLARATYVGSSDNVWPWSYDTCSRSLQKQQEISACNVVNHFDLFSRKGRGAPEIDILEAMPGKEVLKKTPINRPYFSASLQTSPGVPNDGSRPDTGSSPVHTRKWYHDGLAYGENTSLNIFFYGTKLNNPSYPEKSYQTDAISANHQLQKTHFTDFHKYRLEWATGSEGYIRWYLDDELLYGITADTLNLTGSVIPDEPMYLIFNTAMSKTWGFPAPCPNNCACSCFDCRKSDCLCGVPSHMCANFPAHFLIDYVRVYQSPAVPGQKVGCSTPERPTSKFIKGHMDRYKQATDDIPLQPLVRGGGACVSNAQCTAHQAAAASTSHTAVEDMDADEFSAANNDPSHHSGAEESVVGGTCRRGTCLCAAGFVGPHCLVADARDDVTWEDPDLWPQHPRPFHFALSLKVFVAAVLVVFAGLVTYRVHVDGGNCGKYGRRTQYESIDDQTW